jgi:hypothetical protein
MSDISGVIADGRAAFNSLLTDTVKVTKPGTGKGAFNNTTGQYATPARTTVYEGPGRIQVKADINSNVVETTAGEREWTYLTATLQLPVETPEGAIGSVAAIDVDHVCEILTSPMDPSMVGSEFNVQGRIGPKSHEVYRRYRLRQVVA